VDERLSARLRADAADTRARCLEHPFVLGLADGSLPPDVFARWVRQDWLYLDTYARVLALAAAHAPTRPARTRWAGLLHLTLHHELDLHRAFAARFGLTPCDLEATPAWSATRAYTTFLWTEARAGYGRLLAAVLPCGVGYVELARALASGPRPADPRYADWIATYDDPDFREAVAFMEAELDALEPSRAAEAALARTYLAGAAHELAFWDQLWHGGP
jgi:thiaminase (transcriptional activator TenA)